MKDFRVAAVQMNGLLGRNAENLAVHEEFIVKAAAAGAQLVVFPETSIPGHWCEAGAIVAAEDSREGPTTRRLSELCRKLGLYVGAGIAEAANGAVYNGYVLVGPEGFLGCQRKVHPSGDEYFFYRAGSSFDVFDLPFARVGVSICADTMYPESSRVAALKGAELVLAPHACRCGAAPKDADEMRQRIRGNKDYYLRFNVVRAIENGLFVIYANQAGVAGQVKRDGGDGDADVVHAGGVFVIRPSGDVQAELVRNDFQADMLVADLKAADLGAARGRKCFSLLTRRPSAYGIIADEAV